MRRLRGRTWRRGRCFLTTLSCGLNTSTATETQAPRAGKEDSREKDFPFSEKFKQDLQDAKNLKCDVVLEPKVHWPAHSPALSNQPQASWSCGSAGSSVNPGRYPWTERGPTTVRAASGSCHGERRAEGSAG